MKRIVATSTREIGKILDYVHDRAFDLSKMQFDKRSGTLSIPLTVVSDETQDLKQFLFVKLWKNPVVQATLLIKNATNFSLKDDAQIDQGIINTIIHDGGWVLIKCSVPVEIKVEIARLELELALSDTVTSRKSRFAFG